ncbi:LysR family transcriptional regulator [Flavobacterium sufflavum]|uniref:LysR family transcriptional regulator n=1 Tax=Flavobacterium sufflavum TaxID=1921138 RepID=A0A437KWA4_9FLAO|nr:LysR family transcriptional regulator [Flavobacterium sufflavum]RVT76649.1 LysR family transcriptional regulator [Flavobacterium sufflavum]
MELRKLKSFLVVAKELHFGKAAEKLNITQPALTHQINQLEIELGFELFDKDKRINHRKVELTESGSYLMKEMGRVVELLDRTIKKAQTYSEKSKQLRFGIPKISRSSEVLSVVQKLQNILPNTTFKIIEFSSGVSIQEAVFKGEIDFGITILPLVYKTINYHVVNQEFLNVIMSVKHPLAKYKSVKIEQLRNDKWVELNKELLPSFTEDLEMSCRNVGFSREANIVQEVTNLDLLLGLVNAQVGVAIFPAEFPLNSDEIVSKELFISDNSKLGMTKILVFKDNFNGEYHQLLKDNW